jgi:hypothetical protein
MIGKSLSEFIAVVGQPSSYSAMAGGQTLVQWQATGCHMAILFDASGRFVGISHQYAQYASGPDYLYCRPSSRRKGCAWCFGIVGVALLVLIADFGWNVSRSDGGESVKPVETPPEMQTFANHCESMFSENVQCRADGSRRLLTVTGQDVTRASAVKFMNRERKAAKSAGFELISFWNGKTLPDKVFAEDFPVDKPK